jgi:hypothetical protein
MVRRCAPPKWSTRALHPRDANWWKLEKPRVAALASVACFSLTVKFMAFELSASVPPPPLAPVPAIAGLVTDTRIVAGLAISLAGIVALTRLVLM